MTTSGATTGWTLAPGETDVITASANIDQGERLTIYAALMADGSGEGDSKEVARMKDYRAGIEKQFRRATLILRRAQAAPDSAPASAVLADLQGQLSALPEASSDLNATSPGLASGLSHAKEFILEQLKLSQSRLARDNALRAVKTDVGRLLTHLEKVLPRLQSNSSPLP